MSGCKHVCVHDDCFGVHIIASVIGRIVVILSNGVLLIVFHHLGLSCFASLDAFVPCVLKFPVASSPTVSKPGTTATTATEFTRFRDGATCEAYRTDGRRRGG